MHLFGHVLFTDGILQSSVPQKTKSVIGGLAQSKNWHKLPEKPEVHGHEQLPWLNMKPLLQVRVVQEPATLLQMHLNGQTPLLPADPQVILLHCAASGGGE